MTERNYTDHTDSPHRACHCPECEAKSTTPPRWEPPRPRHYPGFADGPTLFSDREIREFNARRDAWFERNAAALERGWPTD